MTKIGVTGGIGSGKTTVCQVFELLGIPVFYADYEAKKVMQNDLLLMDGIKEAFGPESFFATGELNRKHLAEIVFNNPEKLHLLNSLVHPAVFRAFDRWASEQKSQYVIKEAALLFESGSYKDCTHTLLVTAPEAMRIDRVVKRDRVSEEEVKRRMDKQLPDSEKEKLADLVLQNDEKELLIPQILQLHQMFLGESSAE